MPVDDISNSIFFFYVSELNTTLIYTIAPNSRICEILD